MAHPLADIRLALGMVKVYGPRNTAELDTVTGQTSHAYATAPLAPEMP